MTWMLTATGRDVDLRFIDADRICIEDIATSLAKLCRFNGHTLRHYSVAEHSVVVVDLLEHIGVNSPAVLLAGLLHDAHEAYTGDLSSPMKELLGAAWSREESRIQHAVMKHFGVSTAYVSGGDAIKWADLTALATERLQLMHPGGPEWPVMSTHRAAKFIDLKSRPGDAKTWEEAFLSRYQSLTYELRLKHGLDPDADDVSGEWI